MPETVHTAVIVDGGYLFEHLREGGDSLIEFPLLEGLNRLCPFIGLPPSAKPGEPRSKSSSDDNVVVHVVDGNPADEFLQSRTALPVDRHRLRVRWHRNLRDQFINVHLTEYKRNRGTPCQLGADALIATLACQYMWQHQATRVVLITGDGDLTSSAKHMYMNRHPSSASSADPREPPQLEILAFDRDSLSPQLRALNAVGIPLRLVTGEAHRQTIEYAQMHRGMSDATQHSDRSDVAEHRTHHGTSERTQLDAGRKTQLPARSAKRDAAGPAAGVGGSAGSGFLVTAGSALRTSTRPPLVQEGAVPPRLVCAGPVATRAPSLAARDVAETHDGIVRVPRRRRDNLVRKHRLLTSHLASSDLPSESSNVCSDAEGDVYGPLVEVRLDRLMASLREAALKHVQRDRRPRARSRSPRDAHARLSGGVVREVIGVRERRAIEAGAGLCIADRTPPDPPDTGDLGGGPSAAVAGARMQPAAANEASDESGSDGDSDGSDSPVVFSGCI
eukprot:TRINITY_DN68128_c0_g1_i1.p1 TRINITY_DN68128_c0_g1~~TRINITY_DN68128_c0_g1_i1.p1  ORF type:complete len:504 (+),score=33.49 TRINITY_DN68128_c0_g1_i1:132-1643(+)